QRDIEYHRNRRKIAARESSRHRTDRQRAIPAVAVRDGKRERRIRLEVNGYRARVWRARVLHHHRILSPMGSLIKRGCRSDPYCEGGGAEDDLDLTILQRGHGDIRNTIHIEISDRQSHRSSANPNQSPARIAQMTVAR